MKKKAYGALVFVVLAFGTTLGLLMTSSNGPGPFASQQAPGVWVCLPSKTATVTGQTNFVAEQATTVDSVRLEHDTGIRLLGFKLTTQAIGSAAGWRPGPSHIQAHSFWLAFGLERTGKVGRSRDVAILYTVGGTRYQWNDPVTFTMQPACPS